MTARVKPGLAVSIVTDRGFAVGLYTHKDPKMGELIWIADGFWDEEPTVQDVQRVERWRWCVFFPLGAAVRRRLVSPIGTLPISKEFEDFPVMRAGSKQQGWFIVRGGEMENFGFERTDDRGLPPRILVNDTRLKEMLVSDWTPEEWW